MEREVIVQALPTAKKRLALDTDWLTALSALSGFLVCVLTGVALTWSTLRGSFKASAPSWSTPLLAAMLIYVALRDSGKPFKTAVLVYAIGPVSRTVLWLFRTSDETQFINEIFIRWIYVILCLAGCVYTIYWFKTKIRYV
jgi:hypothetical protein